MTSRARRLAGKGLLVYRRHGLRGTVRRLAQEASLRAQVGLWYDRDTVCYGMLLDGPRPHPAVPPGLGLRTGGTHDLHHLEALPATGFMEAEAWLADGAQFWLLLDEAEEPAFGVWLFRGRAPIWGATGGWLPLPAGVAALEAGHTAASYRGRGIASAVYARIADALLADGERALIGVTDRENVPPQRALTKAGMEPIAEMRIRRRLGRAALHTRPLAPLGEELAALWGRA